MTARRRHRQTLLRDLDVLHALAVATAALLLTGGLLYVAYLAHVWRVARRAAADIGEAKDASVLLFGKHCRHGVPDADFTCRIERAQALALGGGVARVLLLGGGPSPSEAEIAQRELRARGFPPTVQLVREDESRDTLENLRHARRLLRDVEATPVLLSNRYHLARCALLADCLRLPHRLCAAEREWRVTPAQIAAVSGEAALVMWIDIGRRWAGSIGHRRMLAKLS